MPTDHPAHQFPSADTATAKNATASEQQTSPEQHVQRILTCLQQLSRAVLSPHEETRLRTTLADLIDREPVNTMTMCSIPQEPFLYGDFQTRKQLASFRIKQYPVTNREYAAFLRAHPTYPIPYLDQPGARLYNWDPLTRCYPYGMGHFPVVLVSYQDALAYCEWTGKQLPSGMQWEKAARGTDGRSYPWGNLFDASKANTRESHIGMCTPVTLYEASASPYHIYDLVGNVWEWTRSTVTRGCGLRGASFASNALHAQVTFKNSMFPEAKSIAIGFRVVDNGVYQK